MAALFQSPTIEQLATLIDSDLSQKRWSPLIPLYQASVQPQESLLAPLFLIGGAGGNALYLQPLAQHLGKDRSIYGLQAQGLDGTAPPLQSIPEIAAQYIKAIQTVQPKGPYWLAGHSIGGKVAFEMAIQLQQRGESVAFVGILDTPAPLPESNLEQAECKTWDNATWLSSIAETIENLIEKEIDVSYSELAALSESQQFDYFQAALEKVEFLPQNSDAQSVHGLVEVYKTQCPIQYLPEQVPSVPVTLFRAQEINTELKNALPLSKDLTWGWATFSTQTVDVWEVPGNHVSMMRPPHVQTLAKQLNQSLLNIQNPYQQLSKV